MIDLIKQALREYFNEYQKFHLLILISFTIIIALIQVIQSIWVSSKIEKFKNALKRSEIKFSRYNNLQVDALKEIYEKLVLFHGTNSILFKSSYDSNVHENYRNRITNWIKAYIECSNKFSLEKILLPNNLKNLVTRTLTDFEEVKNLIISERDYLDYKEEYYEGNMNAMYEAAELELEVINEQINKIKSKDSIIRSEKNILELRKTIEDYFEKMNE
jgi:hypothetical protein